MAAVWKGSGPEGRAAHLDVADAAMPSVLPCLGPTSQVSAVVVSMGSHIVSTGHLRVISNFTIL